MSTEDEKRSEAYRNIEICCQTLCDKEAVLEYIRYLEQENEILSKMLQLAARM